MSPSILSCSLLLLGLVDDRIWMESWYVVLLKPPPSSYFDVVRSLRTPRHARTTLGYPISRASDVRIDPVALPRPLLFYKAIPAAHSSPDVTRMWQGAAPRLSPVDLYERCNSGSHGGTSTLLGSRGYRTCAGYSAQFSMVQRYNTPP